MQATIIIMTLTMAVCGFQVWRFNEQSQKIIIKNNYIEKGKVKYTDVFTANLSEACIKNN